MRIYRNSEFLTKVVIDNLRWRRPTDDLPSPILLPFCQSSSSSSVCTSSVSTSLRMICMPPYGSLSRRRNIPSNQSMRQRPEDVAEAKRGALASPPPLFQETRVADTSAGQAPVPPSEVVERFLADGFFVPCFS